MEHLTIWWNNLAWQMFLRENAEGKYSEHIISYNFYSEVCELP